MQWYVRQNIWVTNAGTLPVCTHQVLRVKIRCLHCCYSFLVENQTLTYLASTQQALVLPAGHGPKQARYPKKHKFKRNLVYLKNDLFRTT